MAHTRSARRSASSPSPLLDTSQLELGQQICDTAATIDAPFDAEWFVSDLLGRVWQRRNVPRAGDLPEEYEMALGTMVQTVVAAGGLGARILLETIRRLDRGALGTLAAMRSDALAGPEAPKWVRAVGTAQVVSARSAALSGSGEGLFLLAKAEGIPAHTLAVFIDDSTGGIAKHLHLVGQLGSDEITAPSESLGDVKLHPADPVLACARVAAAIERTDSIMLAPVGDRYAEFRAMALARVTPPASGIRAA